MARDVLGDSNRTGIDVPGDGAASGENETDARSGVGVSGAMSQQAAVTVSTSKTCSRCAHELPISAFRRVFTGKPWPVHSACNQCQNRPAPLESVNQEGEFLDFH